MRLKRIELFGFKSFADKTLIHFDQGVTCIVGPNGCGKSNISDAIRWVLGERSTKLLRGSKMEDVIFNGTDFRKPIAFTEVSLTVDNEDRGLAIDYHEVTLTRRLYRSGDSEYLINKTACRLKDIQDLILDTGIGSNSYSMIEQGRIDYILNADPEERRFLIEEAAGIAKFKVKKDEAIRKLERTEENRLRLQDIVHEVHRNIQYAERQARRAERYKQELEKLKDLEIRKAFHEIKLLHQEKQKIELERTQIQAEILKLESAAAQIQQAQKEEHTALQKILLRFKETESQQYSLQSKKEQAEQRAQHLEERLLEIAGRRGQIEQEFSMLELRIQKNQEECEIKQKDLKNLMRQKEELLESQKTVEAAAHQLKEQIQSAKVSLEAIKLEAFQAASETARLRSESHRIHIQLENSEARRSKQAQNQSKLLQEKAEWGEKAKRHGDQISELEIKLGFIGQQKQILTEKRSRLENSLMILNRENDQLERTLQSSSSRLEWLSEMESTHQGKENRILELLGQNRTSLIALRRILKAQPGYEWALEAALWSFSNIFLSENEAILQDLFQNFSRDKALRFEVLLNPLHSIDAGARHAVPLRQPNHPLITSSLKDVVEIMPPYQDILAPLIENIYLVKETPMEELLKELRPQANQAQFLCPNGVFIGPRGVISFAGTSDKAGASFQRSSEIQDLSEKVPCVKADLENRKASLAHIEAEIREAEGDLRKIEEERMDALIQKESFESLNKGVQDRLHSVQLELGLLEFEHEEMNTQELQAIHKQQELEQLLREGEAREKSIHTEQETLLARLDQLNMDYSRYIQEVAEKKTQLEHHEEKRQLFEDSLALVETHLKEDQTRLSGLAVETGELQKKRDQILEEQKILRESLKSLEQEITQVSIRLSDIHKEKTQSEEKLNAREEALRELRMEQQKFQDSLHKHDLTLMDLGYQEKAIGERLIQSYRLHLEEVDPSRYSPIENEAEFNDKLDELRKRVESMGTVNLLAIEEYEELKKRYDFLMTQQKDLEDAKESLLEAIRKINRTTKSLFEETFISVQKTFQEYYQTLFQGGIARLTLVDETNPLESGIDIMVRPPGKKTQHISLLSGGEKALTAIALLFALFKIKPSPFCVLDEVDAPLDEANIDRFLNVLKSFLTASQFIIVTHNRKTISMGDGLYGVTMQEAGVSKIVSVKINRDETKDTRFAEAVAVKTETQTPEPQTQTEPETSDTPVES